MADCLKRNAVSLASSVLMVLALPALAQTLADPTRPPTAVAVSVQENEAAQGAVLQSVLIPKKGRPLVVLGGQTIKLGEMFGDRKLIKVTEKSAVLESATGEKETLLLTPGIEKTEIVVKKNRKAPARGRSPSEVKQ